VGTPSVTVTVTTSERRLLEPLARAKTAPQRLVERCRIVLLSAEGWTNETQADELGIDRQCVRRWRHRWARARPALDAAEQREASAKDLEKLIIGILTDDDRCGARRLHDIGPLIVPPGQHALTFQSSDAPSISDGEIKSRARRRVSIAVGTWNWSVRGEQH